MIDSEQEICLNCFLENVRYVGFCRYNVPVFPVYTLTSLVCSLVLQWFTTHGCVNCVCKSVYTCVKITAKGYTSSLLVTAGIYNEPRLE